MKRWNQKSARAVATRGIGALSAGLLAVAGATVVALPASAVACSWGATDNYASHWASTEEWSGCSSVWAQHRYTPPGTSTVAYKYDSDPIYARTTAASVMNAGYHGGS
jgi:hypothetical protein